MDTYDSLITFGISLGLGLLVGLQRERKGDEVAGIRTFALLTLFGTLAAMLGESLATWAVPAGALVVGALMLAGTIHKGRINLKDIGLTTEFAGLVMYGLGAFLVKGDRPTAIALGGVVALLLYWKAPLHGFVRRLEDPDVAAIMQFVLVALVILPILPNKAMGPYLALNPFETWLIVVLVVGMSLAGYVLYKVVPPTAGALLGGILGGLVSSTATTVSYARRTRLDPETTPLALQAIMIANTMSVLRVILLVVLFAHDAAAAIVWPLVVLAGAMALASAVAFTRPHSAAKIVEHGNPAELRSALFFGATYALVKLATAWGKATFGAAALFLIGGLSGLTDVDAITLSMSDMTSHSRVNTEIAWRVIVTAILANLVFKAGCVLVLGNSALRKSIVAFFGALLLAGAALLLWFPALR